MTISPVSDAVLDAALAISELLDGETDLIRGIEGYLLTRSAQSDTVTPADLAREHDVSGPTARDICRQLESVGAITSVVTPAIPEKTEYECDTDECLAVLEAATTTSRILRRDAERRQPQPTVEPLVTLPADPSFEEVSPQDIGFDWLMPRLLSAINGSQDHIRILMPFFERDGFERLQPSLTAALERGVTVTIVTRYLSDSTSHNYAVLSSFVSELDAGDIPRSGLELVEYTPETATGEGARQEGAPPEFTLHAKVMAFDETAVYIGSANVTDYGFEKYLELGVLLGGPPVMTYRQMFARLLESPSARVIQL